MLLILKMLLLNWKQWCYNNWLLPDNSDDLGALGKNCNLISLIYQGLSFQVIKALVLFIKSLVNYLNQDLSFIYQGLLILFIKALVLLSMA